VALMGNRDDAAKTVRWIYQAWPVLRFLRVERVEIEYDVRLDVSFVSSSPVV
jgi:hypothetical protein